MPNADLESFYGGKLQPIWSYSATGPSSTRDEFIAWVFGCLRLRQLTFSWNDWKNLEPSLAKFDLQNHTAQMQGENFSPCQNHPLKPCGKLQMSPARQAPQHYDKALKDFWRGRTSSSPGIQKNATLNLSRCFMNWMWTECGWNPIINIINQPFFRRVTIPPIRMVMTGGWFTSVVPTLIWTIRVIESHCFDLSMLLVWCWFPTPDGEGCNLWLPRYLYG